MLGLERSVCDGITHASSDSPHPKGMFARSGFGGKSEKVFGVDESKLMLK